MGFFPVNSNECQQEALISLQSLHFSTRDIKVGTSAFVLKKNPIELTKIRTSVLTPKFMGLEVYRVVEYD